MYFLSKIIKKKINNTTYSLIFKFKEENIIVQHNELGFEIIVYPKSYFLIYLLLIILFKKKNNKETKHIIIVNK